MSRFIAQALCQLSLFAPPVCRNLAAVASLDRVLARDFTQRIRGDKITIFWSPPGIEIEVSRCYWY